MLGRPAPCQTHGGLAGLEDGKPVVSPGVKNPDPAIETHGKVDELGDIEAGVSWARPHPK